jgi:hypothetical protein
MGPAIETIRLGPVIETALAEIRAERRGQANRAAHPGFSGAGASYSVKLKRFASWTCDLAIVRLPARCATAQARDSASYSRLRKVDDGLQRRRSSRAARRVLARLNTLRSPYDRR